MKRSLKILTIIVLILATLALCTSCSLLSNVLQQGGTVGGNVMHIEVDDLDTSNPAALVASNTISSCVRVIVTLQNSTVLNGAGFIITEDGYVVTNRHVVVRYESKSDLPQSVNDKRVEIKDIKIVFADNTYLEAEEKFFCSKAGKDVAILMIKNGDAKFVPIELDQTSQVYYGQDAYTFGNPEGIGLLFAHATIASPALSFTSNGTEFKDIIMIDSNVNHGNSGGVLLNSKGRAIGLVYGRIESESGSVNKTYGIGCVLPIKDVIAEINNSVYSSSIKFVEYKEEASSGAI